MTGIQSDLQESKAKEIHPGLVTKMLGYCDHK